MRSAVADNAGCTKNPKQAKGGFSHRYINTSDEDGWVVGGIQSNLEHKLCDGFVPPVRLWREL